MTLKGLRNNSGKIIPRLVLQTNPALWFVLAYILAGISLAFYFNELINPREMSLFTFFWTLAALLIVFTAINFKRLIRLKKDTPSLSISRVYAFSMYHFLPYILIGAVYEFLLIFSNAFKNHFKNIDMFLMKTDLTLFGINPALCFEGRYHPAAVEYFMVAYGLYLVYPYFYLLYLFQKNRITVLHRAILAQILALIISFTCFIVFPAYGPRFVCNPEHPLSRPDMPQFTQQIRGIEIGLLKDLTGRSSFYELQFHGWNSLERVKTDCMPSMHVCLCLICLFYAMRYRKIFKWRKTSIWFWIIGVSSLTFSTVYLRYHWITDVAVGAVLAVLAYLITEKIYSAWLGYREKNGLPMPEAAWLSEYSDLFRN